MTHTHVIINHCVKCENLMPLYQRHDLHKQIDRPGFQYTPEVLKDLSAAVAIQKHSKAGNLSKFDILQTNAIHTGVLPAITHSMKTCTLLHSL